jgi:hypothetical protein
VRKVAPLIRLQLRAARRGEKHRGSQKRCRFHGKNTTLIPLKYGASGGMRLTGAGPFVKATKSFGPVAFRSVISKYTRYGPSGTTCSLVFVQFHDTW